MFLQLKQTARSLELLCRYAEMQHIEKKTRGRFNMVKGAYSVEQM